jgi:hypothetical protein
LHRGRALRGVGADGGIDDQLIAPNAERDHGNVLLQGFPDP